ncbi:MBL fold metallo-hydrolase [Natronomonas sp. EA1]|uniref:MBL fold metallo-hydrolase n=1 Tax=Natronomonas sp. EA1 TaxID=3421655 RepID=UPI003EBFEBC2
MVTTLRDGVWQIDLTGVNAYLADDDGTLTLIDAGMPTHTGAIRGAVDAAGFSVSDIDRVLITHFDIDHVGGLAALGVDEIYMGAPDVPYLTKEAKPPLGNRKGALQRVVSPLIRRPDADITPVADGDTVGSFRVYATPGHTPGHVAYVSDALDAAFVGDLVLERDGELRPSPWYLSYDTERVRQSIHELADEEPAVEVLAMGHGVPFTRDGSIRLAELGERIERR